MGLVRGLGTSLSQSLSASQAKLSPRQLGKQAHPESTRHMPGFFCVTVNEDEGQQSGTVIPVAMEQRPCDFPTAAAASKHLCFPMVPRIPILIGNGDEVGIQHHSIHGAHALDLSGRSNNDVHVVIAHGRGTRLLVPIGWLSVTLVLGGLLELNSGDAPWQLATHHLQLWLDGGLRHTNRNPAWWLCIAAPASLWEQLPRTSTAAGHLIPRETRCDLELARAMLHLARPDNFSNTRDPTATLDGMALLRDVLLEKQQPLHELLDRCSGRTAQRRHQTMLRLLRVQHLIRCNMDARLDLNHLATIANYSPLHLIRVYRDVFDETPFEYASRLRLQRAWQLVRGTELSICEIAISLGFETESAFCRAFKQAFACTASQARQHRDPQKSPVEPACTMQLSDVEA